MQHKDMTNVTVQEAMERGLAVFGFLALITLGVWLAVYSSRFVPGVVSRAGGAAAALSAVFVPGNATLSVVPNATTTLSFENELSAPPAEEPVVTPAPEATAPQTPAPVAPAAGPQTAATFPIATGTSASVTAPTLSGLPDLIATIITPGYLTSTSTDSFVASTTIRAGVRVAVKFSIKNMGGNVVPSGWHFSASIPTQNAYVFYSPAQQALSPGDSIEYTLGFDQASPGVGRSISIVADSDQRVAETIEGNNSATAQVTILNY